jgi:hypothetical protein
VLIAGIGLAIMLVTWGTGVARKHRSFDRDELKRFKRFAEKIQREQGLPFE